MPDRARRELSGLSPGVGGSADFGQGAGRPRPCGSARLFQPPSRIGVSFGRTRGFESRSPIPVPSSPEPVAERPDPDLAAMANARPLTATIAASGPSIRAVDRPGLVDRSGTRPGPASAVRRRGQDQGRDQVRGRRAPGPAATGPPPTPSHPPPMARLARRLDAPISRAASTRPAESAAGQLRGPGQHRQPARRQRQDEQHPGDRPGPSSRAAARSQPAPVRSARARSSQGNARAPTPIASGGRRRRSSRRPRGSTGRPHPANKVARTARSIADGQAAVVAELAAQVRISGVDQPAIGPDSGATSNAPADHQRDRPERERRTSRPGSATRRPNGRIAATSAGSPLEIRTGRDPTAPGRPAGLGRSPRARWPGRRASTPGSAGRIGSRRGGSARRGSGPGRGSASRSG